MLSIEVCVQPDLQPAVSHAVDRALVDAVRRRAGTGVLRAYTMADPTVALGRYHLAPTAASALTIGIHRRQSGGRVAPLGPGFATLALTLPHRSALVASEPLALRPEQALNRCVRGVLAALRGLGVDAYYAGRDVLTVAGRLLGVVSLESEADGVSIFEAVLALDGDWSALPAWVDAVDPTGLIAAERVTADQVTALARHATQAPSLAELAHCLGGAYAQEFGVAVAESTVARGETGADTSRSFDAWLAERRPRPELDRHAVTWGQLGIVEAYLRCDGDGAIADVMLAGDFIADSPAIAELEVRLRGCPLQVAAIDAVVRTLFADPRHFLLGIGPLGVVAETIAGAR
jgi:hypothetical protein